VSIKKTSHVKTAISPKQSTDSSGRAPAYVWFFHNHKWKQRYDSSAKQQAPSRKPHAPIFRKRQAASHKLQAPSDKRPNQSNKRQASSRK